MIDYAEMCKTKKVALQFSGGKDSLALLHMMRPHWKNLTVYYCNSGDSFPETDALMAEVKRKVPYFVEVAGRRSKVEKQEGWASDILDASSSQFGRACGEEGPALLDRYTCCFRSIMEPLHERMSEDGIQVILRGQRSFDRLKSPVRDGEFIDSFQIIYPLDGLTDNQVFDYLILHGIPLPRFYEHGMKSGGDCMTCTAWLEHKQVPYLKKFHPVVAHIVMHRLEDIKTAANRRYKGLIEALED